MFLSENKSNVKIEVRGDGRVYFTVTQKSEEGTETRQFRTNSAGEGLWAVGEREDRQVRGTCQFSVNGVTRSTMRRRILKSVCY